MATPSPLTSGASDASDDNSTAFHRHKEPEPAPLLESDAQTRKPSAKPKPKATTKTPRAKRDPEEQRQAYLARRREIKARARTRQKETSSSLKEQHVLLHKQLQAALATYQQSTREKLQQQLTNNELLLTLWDEYVDALELHHAITQENKQLVERIDEFLLYECRLLLPEFQEDEDAKDLTAKTEPAMLTAEESRTNEQLLREMHSGQPQREGFWAQFLEEHDAPFYYELYTEEECNAVISRHYEMMQQDIQEATTNQWKLTGGCFGWKGYGHIDSTDHTYVRFQFRKTLRRASSVALIGEMTSETVRIFHSPKLYARLYGMRMESQAMQRVNDHTTVILQTMSDEHRFLSLRSFMLFTCVEERLPPTAASGGKPRKAMTILNVVIPPREKDIAIPSPDPHKMMLYMNECLIYMRMEQVNDTDVDVVYGGHANCMSPELARVSVLESVSSFFRWVQQVIPERLLAFE